MVDYLFGSFKTMMTLTKTGNRDTVNGDCGWFSLSSCDRSIANRGTIRRLMRGAPAHLLGLVEEHLSTRPPANAVLSPLGRHMRALPENIGAMSRPRREQASVPMTNSSDRLTRFGRTPSAVLSRPWTLHRITLLVAAVVLMALAGSGARAADPPDAGAFLVNLNHRVGEQLAATDIAPEERERRFGALLKQTLNIEIIGRFVLGRYWRRASDEERKAFIEAFQRAIVHRFLSLLTEYSGGRLSVGRIRPDPRNPALSTVTSRLLRPQGEPVRVEWRIRREGGQYQIVDVVAEGVSIAITLRSEYSSFIRQHGGDVGALTESLRQRVTADAFTPETGGTSRLQ
jgi:phospholipid transport system substrate-binding protein